MPGKRIQFDDETLNALRLLGSDRMATIQELADEAFSDLLAKHGRAVGLKEQLVRSADPPQGKGKPKAKSRSSP